MKDQAFGADFSNYAGEMTPAKVGTLQAAGVRFAIVGYQDGALFEQQVRALAQAGIKVSCYFFIYWSRTGESSRLQRVIDHLRLIEQTGVLFGWPRPDGSDMPKVFLDFEEDTTTKPATNPTPAMAREWGAQMISQVELAGLSCGVYTREDWWKQHTGNYTGFSSRPLWHASQYLTTVPAPFGDYYRGHEYGGWPVPMCWQYRGDVPQGGWTVDYDLEEWEVPQSPAPPRQPRSLTLDNGDGTTSLFVEQLLEDP